jgi:hypothetical protein
MFIGKLISSGIYFSLSIWIVAPITASLFSLYVTGIWRAARKTAQQTLGYSFILALFGAIALYALVSSYTGYQVWLWIPYIWLLSILILWSAVVTANNKDRNGDNVVNN